MAGLMVTEKERGKARMAVRIDQRIEAIGPKHATLLERVQRETHEARREPLLDTIRLAGSTAPIKPLWSKVKERLGDGPRPTRLERQTLSLESAKED